MKNSEMAELFGLMMMAYPNSKMFERGMAPLKATIELWTRALPDMDYWTGQQAMYRVVRTCKFPPTIAEFKAAADEVSNEVKALTDAAVSALRSSEFLCGSVEKYLDSISDGHPIKRAVSAIGGADKLSDGNHWTLDNFKEAYTQIIRHDALLHSTADRALLGAKKG